MSVYSDSESTRFSETSDVETLESATSRPLSPCTLTAEMEDETGLCMPVLNLKPRAVQKGKVQR